MSKFILLNYCKEQGYAHILDGRARLDPLSPRRLIIHRNKFYFCVGSEAL
jgi:hypothetical protein